MPDDPADGLARLDQAAARQATEESAARALAAARARLVLGRDARSAFFACLALRPTPEADWAVGTMASDGKVLGDHPGFVCGLSPDELVGVVAHEVMHNALAHHARRGRARPGGVERGVRPGRLRRRPVPPRLPNDLLVTPPGRCPTQPRTAVEAVAGGRRPALHHHRFRTRTEDDR